MTTSTWDPQNGVSTPALSITPAMLHKFIDLAQPDVLPQLAQHLDSASIREWAAVMQQSQATWEQAVAGMGRADIILLIRFFTIAEEQLPGWAAAEKSPVICLNKVLKQRGEKLDKADLLWIRQNSSNRFLPNGPIQ